MEHVFHIPKQNLLNEDTVHMKKFDFIVGNPPYEYANTFNTDVKLWHEFVEKAIVGMRPGAILSFIVPVSMMTGPGPAKRFRKLFEKHGVCDVISATVHEGQQFKNASVSTCDWVVRKSNELNNLDELFIGGRAFGPLNQTILSKVINQNAPSVFHITDGGQYIDENGVRKLIKKDRYLDEPPENELYVTMHTGANKKVYVAGVRNLISADGWKLALPRSKSPNKQSIFVIPPGVGCDNLHGFIKFETESEAKNAQELFSSKLFIYCAQTYKMSHGKYGNGYKALFNGTKLVINPGFGEWSDSSVFEKFGITEDEQAEILNKERSR